ncbi:hypothetical protein RBG61_02095 [Paludicola sp. MB14-C6]|uniref:hypothetical protein n=1 Tax=Paludihabitans sp. MB14-C6 TaxID=3070656 RepID=UPI0027DE915C|nr:hypothetical protein [Paludicola sp. MB14-C6]WMJ23483.1 hypothetical protein RBG61_02095 [Paludicola sp. MB14-C6]
MEAVKNINCKGVEVQVTGDLKKLMCDLDIAEKKIDLLTSKLQKANLLAGQLSKVGN